MMRGPLRQLRYSVATRPWSLSYIFEKATQQTIPFGLTEAFGEDGRKEEDIPAMELMRRINDHVLDRPLCSQMLFRGEAMAPALSCAPRFTPPASARNQTMNMLIVRPLRHEETMPRTYDRVGGRWFFPRPARVGDVVAFVHPASSSKPPDEQVVLVRRVAALAGDVLVSGEADAETAEETPGTIPEKLGDSPKTKTKTYEIPESRAWVVADNPDVDLSVSPDSRVFGPIPVENILGRVVYAVRSATDHGPVANDPESVREDRAVIETEIDPETVAADLPNDSE